MEEGNSNYLIQLEKLLREASADSVTVMSKRLWKIQLIIDFYMLTDFFKRELSSIKKCYNILIDKDVNYDEWASTDKWKPLLNVLRSRGIDRYDSEGKDRAYDIISLAAECIKVPSEEELNKALKNDNTEYNRLCEKKNKRESFRRLLIELDCSEEISDDELDDAVLKALNTLQIVLKEISKELNSSYCANEKRIALYDELHQRFLPEGPFPIWDAHRKLKEWKSKYYGDESEEDMKDFIMVELFKLLDSGFVICDPEHDLCTSRNKKIYEIKKYLDDNLFDEERRREIISRYTFLRNFLNFKDGFFDIKNKEIIGRYIYENRQQMSMDKIKAFFCFLGLNILVKKELELAKMEKNPKKEYKEIPEELYSFFADSIFVETDNKSRKEKKTLDKDKLIHGISDMLEKWKKPTVEGESRRYRLLYEFLAKKNLIKESNRKLYKQFVKNLLCYRFSLSEDDIAKVSNNISKANVKDSYIDMDDDDKQIYDEIKKNLTEMISVKEDIYSVD